MKEAAVQAGLRPPNPNHNPNPKDRRSKKCSNPNPNPNPHPNPSPNPIPNPIFNPIFNLSIQTKYLKKWSGPAVCADPSVLYRPREDSQIGVTEVAIEHKKQRLIRRHQLATSRDPQPHVREIHGRFAAFQHRKKTNAPRHQWLACVEMDELLAEVTTGKIKGISSDGAGVGYGVR